MPKLKTHRGASKRFKITENGRIKRKNPNQRHLLTNKSRKRKRHLRLPDFLSGTKANNIKKLLH